MVVPNLKVDSYALLTRPPLCPKTSFDLHVLSIPPAFILSQDQTLHFEFVALFDCFLLQSCHFLYLTQVLVVYCLSNYNIFKVRCAFGVASFSLRFRHLFNISNLLWNVNYFFNLFLGWIFIWLKPAHNAGFSPQWVRHC